MTSPKNQRFTTVAVTDAMMTGMKLAMVYSIITTSIAKMTPAIGVLKEAPMAAAEPHATRVRMLLFGRSDGVAEQAR